jgi:hypothetical protein
LLRALVFILSIAIVLFLFMLHLLLLPRSVINESVDYIANQLVFVCHASAGIQTILLTKPGL